MVRITVEPLQVRRVEHCRLVLLKMPGSKNATRILGDVPKIAGRREMAKSRYASWSYHALY